MSPQKNNNQLLKIIGLAGRGLKGRDDGSDLSNVQYKPNWNFHHESPQYNAYILIKIRNNRII
jgi:hypothetical protein